MKLETSLDLLERVRAHLGNVSYYRVAKILEVNPNTVSNWKVGRSGIAKEYAPRIAELLDEAPEYVLACIEAEREPDAGVRKLWRRIAEAFRSKAAAFIILILSSALNSPPSQAVGAGARVMSAGGSMHYTNRRHRRRRRWTDLLEAWLTWTPAPARAWRLV